MNNQEATVKYPRIADWTSPQTLLMVTPMRIQTGITTNASVVSTIKPTPWPYLWYQTRKGEWLQRP